MIHFKIIFSRTIRLIKVLKHFKGPTDFTRTNREMDFLKDIFSETNGDVDYVNNIY